MYIAVILANSYIKAARKLVANIIGSLYYKLTENYFATLFVNDISNGNRLYFKTNIGQRPVTKQAGSSQMSMHCDFVLSKSSRTITVQFSSVKLDASHERSVTVTETKEFS